MRALLILVISLAAMAAAPTSAAAPGDAVNPAESTASPTTTENAAAREHATPAADAASTTASSQSSASTDAPVKEPTAATRQPAPKPASAAKEDAFQVPPSYKARLRGDETVYCRKEGESGTRFQKTSCYTLAELKYKIEAEKAAADDVTRRARVCSSASACASN